jgi:hypothetical protein
MLDDLAFTLARSQGIEGHMGRDPSGPGAQAAVSGKGPIRQGAKDLLEASLNQIVVVVLTTSENSKQGVIDHPNQSVVDLARDARISLQDRVDQFVVREARRVGVAWCLSEGCLSEASAAR